jgi:succinate-semialdehyde dehydrogenase / glutarate-semialdehyde dehydrogenase
MTTTMKARNPFTGVADYSFEVADAAAVAAACNVVRAAQPAWSARSLEGRAAALRMLAAAAARHRGALELALQQDTGRYRIATIEAWAVDGMIEAAIAHAAAVFSQGAERASMIPGITGRTQLLPYPVVGVIAPWNFPLILSMIDLIPALAAGCGVVLKPSEVTPRYVDPVRRILDEVPELRDVVRIVRGPGSTGAALIDHVDAVVCTGSVRTGRIVAEHAARRFIPAFLELGGKDPIIVTSDADVARAARIIVRASLLASGQACQSLERVYVDRRSHDALLAAIVAEARTVRLTCDEPTGQIGPFIMARQAEIVREHIEDAIARGAKLELGGRIVERGGVWCEATVLSGVDHTMKVMREETFGPVIPVMAFDTLDEGIALANDGDYGLSANVLAGDDATAQQIAARLEAGFVSVGDCSMSSFVMDYEWEGLRLSGLGRARLGAAGIARYLRVKAIVTQRGQVASIAMGNDR